jgi:hypothetical protein
MPLCKGQVLYGYRSCDLHLTHRKPTGILKTEYLIFHTVMGHRRFIENRYLATLLVGLSCVVQEPRPKYVDIHIRILVFNYNILLCTRISRM